MAEYVAEFEGFVPVVTLPPCATKCSARILRCAGRDVASLVTVAADADGHATLLGGMAEEPAVCDRPSYEATADRERIGTGGALPPLAVPCEAVDDERIRGLPPTAVLRALRVRDEAAARSPPVVAGLVLLAAADPAAPRGSTDPLRLLASLDEPREARPLRDADDGARTRDPPCEGWRREVALAGASVARPIDTTEMVPPMVSLSGAEDGPSPVRAVVDTPRLDARSGVGDGGSGGRDECVRPLVPAVRPSAPSSMPRESASGPSVVPIAVRPRLPVGTRGGDGSPGAPPVRPHGDRERVATRASVRACARAMSRARASSCALSGTQCACEPGGGRPARRHEPSPASRSPPTSFEGESRPPTALARRYETSRGGTAGTTDGIGDVAANTPKGGLGSAFPPSTGASATSRDGLWWRSAG